VVSVLHLSCVNYVRTDIVKFGEGRNTEKSYEDTSKPRIAFRKAINFKLTIVIVYNALKGVASFL